MPTGSFRRNCLYLGGYRLHCQGNKMRFALALLAMVLFTNTVEAQVFPNAFWNRTSSCAGSQTSSPGLFARIAQRRASRVQARTRTVGCGGVMAESISLGCGGVSTTSGCGGTVSYQQYVPSVINSVEPAPVCVNGQCTITQAAPIKPIAPTKTFPKITPTTDQLFGLSASNDSFPNHILAQIAPSETFGLETTIPNHVLGQIDSQPVKVADSFRPSLLKAIAEGRKSGKLSVRDAVKLRVACLSPAFVERAHELAVTQMAFSGESSEFVPIDDDGMIESQGINWEGLAKFLEAFIPLLITLLKAFGM